jgi:hypothetical protein
MQRSSLKPFKYIEKQFILSSIGAIKITYHLSTVQKKWIWPSRRIWSGVMCVV